MEKDIVVPLHVSLWKIDFASPTIGYSPSQIKMVESSFPLDIIMEIFSWLPAKSLLRFKSLSKQFYSSIQDLKFIEKHYDRATRIDHMVGASFELDSARFKTSNYEYFSQFHGLIVGKDLNSDVYHIRNPATHQILRLPDPHEHTVWLVPAYKSFTDSNKLLSMYKTKDHRHRDAVGFEILTAGKDKHWRPMKLPDCETQNNTSSIINMMNCAMPLSSGIFHLWVVIGTNEDGFDMCLEVHSFDIMNECFISAARLPRGLFSDLHKVWVVLWNECVAVADIANQALNVLVLEDEKEKRWSKSKIVVPLKFLQRGNINYMGLMLDNLKPLYARSDKLVFLINKEYYMYDMKSQRLLGKPRKKFSMKPSLVTLEGMIPEEY